MDTQQKLEILAKDSRFDLACACGTKYNNDHRQRDNKGLWLYPATLPGGGTTVMLKTLISNICINDCKYCPLRNNNDIQRCSIPPDDLAKIFINYVHNRELYGLFLSSGIIRNPDYTMDRIIAVADILRNKYNYKGYIHLKIMPGSSDQAIEKAISLSNAVSLNIEVTKKSLFLLLSDKKDYSKDIIRPLKRISELTTFGAPYQKVKQTTQFIIGAVDDNDFDIVKSMFIMYHKLGIHRIYFNAYQHSEGSQLLISKRIPLSHPEALLIREHRLYQVDYLIRLYKWNEDDIIFTSDGNLALENDPKQIWADHHPEFFPVRLMSADLEKLLRIPGLGLITARKIILLRNKGLHNLEAMGIKGKRLKKILKYIVFE